MENSQSSQDQNTLDYRPYLASMEEKLANIEAERLALEAKEAVLRKSISSIRELIALESGQVVFSRSEEVIIPKRAFKAMAMMDAIEKLYTMVKIGQTARQVADYLKEGGIDSKSKFFVSNVRTALKRQGPTRGIVRRGNTYWKAEWPNTPKEEESDKHEEPPDNEPADEEKAS